MRGSPSESPVMLVSCSTSDGTAMHAYAVVMLERQAAVGLQRTCEFVPLSRCSPPPPSNGRSLYSDQMYPKAVIDSLLDLPP